MDKRPSVRMTPDIVKKIKSLLASGKYYQHQIAAIVGVNPGRVSEVKSGRYD